MLEKIQEKPHHIKQAISLVITVIIFSAILFVWVSSRDARSRELEVQAKTVSPTEGVASMFSGLVADFKKKMANSDSFGQKNDASATSTDTFDLSGVVIIDPSATTTASTTATTTATSTPK